MGCEVRRLTKAYGGVTVMESVDFAVHDGEIHALIGANGAGKSTLIKCVSGAVQPDAGQIIIEGETFSSLTPKRAREAGVSVIYQDFSVAVSLNVTENIFLGQELRWGPFVRRRAQRAEAKMWIERLSADFAPQAPLDSLGGAGFQLVEIIKAIRQKPKVLILDEPTAALTEAEASQLVEQLRKLREHGLPIVYVTHRLGEVFELADRVTVMSGGEVVLSRAVGEVTRQDLVDAIAGRARVNLGRRAGAPGGRAADRAVLEARGLLARGIGPVDINAHRGEILGIYGLLGSGRTELLETLFGAQTLIAGEIRLDGVSVRFRHPSQAVAAGVALVPSDRLSKGIFLLLPGLDNMLLPSLTGFATGGFRRRQREAKAFSETAERLNLQPRRSDIEGKGFSGGNQQKLVLGRWLPTECKVLLLDEPTQGVDVGARGELYAALASAAQSGRAVIVTSSEPEELAQLAHRVLVLSRARVVGELSGDEITERRLLELGHIGE